MSATPLPPFVPLAGPDRDDIVALLADAGVPHDAAAVQGWLADERVTVAGWREGERLVAAYVIRRVSLMNEVEIVAVAPDRWRQGLGRAAMQDALRRSGKRPLAVEADAGAAPFFKRIGFKIVGKRRQPDGSLRERLGWHAPGLRHATPGDATAKDVGNG